MKEKKKLSLPAWIFIGMVAGILVGLCFLKAGSIGLFCHRNRYIRLPP